MQSLLKDLQAFGGQYGYAVLLASGERTCADQERIYRQLRRPFVPCSYHLSGDAIDVQLVLTEPVGVIAAGTLLARMGALAKSKGFRWGGDFGDPNERNHFDDGLRVGAASCCGGGTSVPSRTGREGVAQTGRRKGTRAKICRCCGRSYRVEEIRKPARRGRRYKTEPPCDDIE